MLLTFIMDSLGFLHDCYVEQVLTVDQAELLKVPTGKYENCEKGRTIPSSNSGHWRWMMHRGLMLDLSCHKLSVNKEKSFVLIGNQFMLYLVRTMLSAIPWHCYMKMIWKENSYGSTLDSWITPTISECSDCSSCSLKKRMIHSEKYIKKLRF